jgi:murein DD-endopeptidase MepM/ murein hydrolase activator NlpD
MRPRENVPAALIRAGVDAAEASRAAAALADEFDTVNPHPGKALILTLLADGPRRARLMEMDFSPRDFDSISLTRSGDGQFHLTRAESPIYTTLIHTRGLINGSLYLSIVEAGVEPDMASMVVALFGRRLDLTRDVGSGDRFRLVFRQRRHVDGEAVGGPELLYADVTTKAGTARLYRYQPDGAAVPQWLDGRGDAGRFALLATPVDGARVTSAFGMRLHPLLGYTRMHQGVDFGAPAGTPVLAAGDGVVEEARWAGDYGRWLKIRHGSNLETGYGHLSGWAPGVRWSPMSERRGSPPARIFTSRFSFRASASTRAAPRL